MLLRSAGLLDRQRFLHREIKRARIRTRIFLLVLHPVLRELSVPLGKIQSGKQDEHPGRTPRNEHLKRMCQTCHGECQMDLRQHPERDKSLYLLITAMQQRELWRREQASKLLLCEAGERGSESIGNRGIGLPRDLQGTAPGFTEKL